MPKQITQPKQNPIDSTNLCELIDDVLKQAKALGATAAEVDTNIDEGYTASVRLGEIDTVEYHRDKGFGVTVYFGQRKGSASTSDTSKEAIRTTIEAACNIARYTSEDPFAGLADPDCMAYEYPTIDLYFPWDLPVENAIELAKDLEQQTLAKDKRLKNSEGASLSTHKAYVAYGNSNGFIGAYGVSRHSVSCTVIAESEKGMERDYSYSVARDAQDLRSISTLATEAAERTLQRLNPVRLTTRTAPIIFDSRLASGLIGSFLSAIRGGNIYRKSSFLIDKVGQQVFPEFMTIFEDPFINKGLASSPFDGEGVKTTARELLSQGVIQTYCMGSYSARKLGLKTTGHAGGNHNISVSTHAKTLNDLLKDMDTGLLVTEVMGQGVNLVTGDYSRGASGFWVEKGEIQYPVSEITIAGNLQTMFKNIAAIGNDLNPNSSIKMGSILISEMMIAGD